MPTRSFIRGHRRFTWPMIPYFLGRYLALGTIIAGLISADLTTQFNCQALYTVLYICAASTTCLSSINLAIRTMVIWNMKLSRVVLLCLLSAGQWVFALLVIIKTRASRNALQGCLLSRSPGQEISGLFVYSSCFDLIVLSLSAIRLLTLNDGKRSRLMNLLFQDGLIYFVVAVLGNMPAAVLALLDLNQLMNSIASLPVNIISMIIATRAVRRLSNFSCNSPSIYMTVVPPGPELPKSIQINVDSMTTSDSARSNIPSSIGEPGKPPYV